MDKRMLIELLIQKEQEYLEEYPRTGESDLKIVWAYWKGTSVTSIALDTPCAEATVYRAIRRVKDFLSRKDSFYEILQSYVQNNPPRYGDGDAHSVLEMLFCRYEDFNNFETDEIEEGFRRLYQHLNDMSPKQMDQVLDATCTLCRDHEKSGFVEGVKVGVRMGMEFYS